MFIYIWLHPYVSVVKLFQYTTCVYGLYYCIYELCPYNSHYEIAASGIYIDYELIWGQLYMYWPIKPLIAISFEVSPKFYICRVNAIISICHSCLFGCYVGLRWLSHVNIWEYTDLVWKFIYVWICLFWLTSIKISWCCIEIPKFRIWCVCDPLIMKRNCLLFMMPKFKPSFYYIKDIGCIWVQCTCIQSPKHVIYIPRRRYTIFLSHGLRHHKSAVACTDNRGTTNHE